MDTAPEANSAETGIAETTWLEAIVGVYWKKTPDGTVILQYVVRNGHRYAIPLNGQSLDLTRRAVSSVDIVGPEAMPQSPPNGHADIP